MSITVQVHTNSIQGACPHCNAAIVLLLSLPPNKLQNQEYIHKSDIKLTRYTRRIPNLQTFGAFRKVVIKGVDYFANDSIAFYGLDAQEVEIDMEAEVADLSFIPDLWSSGLPRVIPHTSADLYTRLIGDGQEATCLSRDIDLAYALYPHAEFRLNEESRHIFVTSGGCLVGLLMSAEKYPSFWPELRNAGG
jgi:hypothetical protein